MTENWKPVPEYEDRYEVSDLGRVRGLGDFHRWKHGRILKNNNNKKYKFVLLYRGGNRKRIYLHRLVALVFIGQSNLEINHKDCDPLNNRVSNLEYVSRKENVIHAAKNSRLTVRLTQEQVTSIKAEYKKVSRKRGPDGKYLNSVLTYEHLAEKYSVSKAAINHIVNGRSWKWL